MGLRGTIARGAALAARGAALLSGLAIPGCGDPVLEMHGAASDGLVFVAGTEDASDLFRVRLSDGAVRPLGETPDRVETWPYWSPAGGRLLFQSRPVGDTRNDLWHWSPGEAVPHPLTQTPARDERWPCWSPDGKRVVYAFRGGTPAAGLAWLDASGRGAVLAATGPKDFFYRPDYAPDGIQVVAQRRHENGRRTRLWLLDGAAPPRRLTTEEGWIEQKPFFDRTGTSVVFTRRRPGEAREIAALRTSDGATETLAAADPKADDHSARPSPTRDEIAFVSDRSGTRDIFLWSRQGGAPRNLTASAAHDEFAPRWSPDGELLVLTRTSPQPAGVEGERLPRGSLELVVIDRAGRVLLETRGMMADWMPPF